MLLCPLPVFPPIVAGSFNLSVLQDSELDRDQFSSVSLTCESRPQETSPSLAPTGLADPEWPRKTQLQTDGLRLQLP